MVDKQSLIFLPLIIMFTICMLSLSGLGDAQELGQGYEYGTFPEPYLYDYTGHPKIHASNFTKYEDAWMAIQGAEYDWGTGEGTQTYAIITNETWALVQTGYFLYETSDGNSTGLLPILYDEAMEAKQGAASNGLLDVTANFNSSYGLIALFVSLLVGIGLAGIHFLGIGESETSLQTIFMGVGFLAVWAVFSVISLNLLALIPLYGSMIYFALTLFYVVGLMLNIGGN